MTPWLGDLIRIPESFEKHAIRFDRSRSRI